MTFEIMYNKKEINESINTIKTSAQFPHLVTTNLPWLFFSPALKEIE